ncbi:MAG TPA: ABC transporter permease [Acidimicrobiales bacterium]|nr:ABC transporter permease [Acidimicrobiales bacterium]
MSEARPTELRAFVAVLRRDLYVTTRELPTFAAQVILQPFFLLFVFGRILTELGYARAGYADLLFPGIVGLTAVVTGLQSTAFPLVIDFSFTKEIEDRLLAPLRTELVAIEKIVYASLRAIVACTVMIPVGIIVLGSIPWRWAAAPQFVAVVVLGALVGSTLGLVLGTLVPPNRINIMFALALTPILFTGASQYPWPSLDKLRWFQVVTALNPLTYVSEGLRGAVVPHVRHMPGLLCIVVLCVAVLVFGWIGLRGFRRRAVD